MIKLFAWEDRTVAKIDEKRRKELETIYKAKVAILLSANVKYVWSRLVVNLIHASWIPTHSYMIPVLVMVSTFFTYVSCMPLRS